MSLIAQRFQGALHLLFDHDPIVLRESSGAGFVIGFKSRFGGASQSHPPEWRHHASVHEFEVEVSRAGPDKMEEGGRGRRTR